MLSADSAHDPVEENAWTACTSTLAEKKRLDGHAEF